MHRATVRIPCRDALVADAVARAIAVEADDVPAGARLHAAAQGSDAVLQAEAGDLSGLRACLQSMVRLGEAARKVAELAS